MRVPDTHPMMISKPWLLPILVVLTSWSSAGLGDPAEAAPDPPAAGARALVQSAGQRLAELETLEVSMRGDLAVDERIYKAASTLVYQAPNRFSLVALCKGATHTRELRLDSDGKTLRLSVGDKTETQPAPPELRYEQLQEHARLPSALMLFYLTQLDDVVSLERVDDEYLRGQLVAVVRVNRNLGLFEGVGPTLTLYIGLTDHLIHQVDYVHGRPLEFDSARSATITATGATVSQPVNLSRAGGSPGGFVGGRVRVAAGQLIQSAPGEGALQGESAIGRFIFTYSAVVPRAEPSTASVPTQQTRQTQHVAHVPVR